MRVSVMTLRRLAILEQSRSVVQPVGLWPAIIRDYDEWSELAEPSQLLLAMETRGTFVEDEVSLSASVEAVVIEPAPAVAPAPDPIQDYLRSQQNVAQQRAKVADPQWVIDYINEHGEH